MRVPFLPPSSLGKQRTRQKYFDYNKPKIHRGAERENCTRRAKRQRPRCEAKKKIRILYRPYGETAVAGDDAFRSKFNTHEQDRTALMYFNARYYDAEIGRFVSADTQIPDLNKSQAYNKYMFCAGNPVRFVDGDGHKWSMKGFCSTVASVAVEALTAGYTTTKAAGDYGEKLYNGIKKTDWGKTANTVGRIATGALIGGVLGGPLGLIYGAMGGYNSASLGQSWGDFMRDSAVLGFSYGYLNPLSAATNIIGGIYLIRMMIIAPIAGSLYILNRLGINTGVGRDDYLNWSFGQESSNNGTRNKSMRSRPWLPGDTHTTGLYNGDGILDDQSPLMVLLDISGTHQTSITHDEGSGVNYNSFSPLGMITASFSSTFGLNTLGYRGTSTGSLFADWIITGSMFGPWGTQVGIGIGAYVDYYSQ